MVLKRNITEKLGKFKILWDSSWKKPHKPKKQKVKIQ